MKNQVAALVVSGRFENRRELLRILDRLPTNVFVVGTLAHAREVLQAQPIAVVFCEERLPDGVYRDLLAFGGDQRKRAQVIVMLSTGEWSEFHEASDLGAEVIRCPLQPTDVELALIHAMRKNPIMAESQTLEASA
jgi:DNA-binding NtrC family response regulator